MHPIFEKGEWQDERSKGKNILGMFALQHGVEQGEGIGNNISRMNREYNPNRGNQTAYASTLLPPTNAISPAIPPGYPPPPPFFFQDRSASLNWTSILSIDINRIIKTADLSSLENLLENITFAQVSSQDLLRMNDPSFIKLFKLAQLSTEYLLFIQDYLEGVGKSLNNEYKSAYSACVSAENEAKKNQRKLLALKKKIKNKKNTLKTYDYLMKQPATNPQVFACRICKTKYFIAEEHLKLHWERRHPTLPYHEESIETDQENLDLNTNSLQEERKKEEENELKRMENDNLDIKVTEIKELFLELHKKTFDQIQREIGTLRKEQSHLAEEQKETKQQLPNTKNEIEMFIHQENVKTMDKVVVEMNQIVDKKLEIESSEPMRDNKPLESKVDQILQKMEEDKQEKIRIIKLQHAKNEQRRKARNIKVTAQKEKEENKLEEDKKGEGGDNSLFDLLESHIIDTEIKSEGELDHGTENVIIGDIESDSDTELDSQYILMQEVDVDDYGYMGLGFHPAEGEKEESPIKGKSIIEKEISPDQKRMKHRHAMGAYKKTYYLFEDKIEELSTYFNHKITDYKEMNKEQEKIFSEKVKRHLQDGDFVLKRIEGKDFTEFPLNTCEDIMRVCKNQRQGSAELQEILREVEVDLEELMPRLRQREHGESHITLTDASSIFMQTDREKQELFTPHSHNANINSKEEDILIPRPPPSPIIIPDDNIPHSSGDQPPPTANKNLITPQKLEKAEELKISQPEESKEVLKSEREEGKEKNFKIEEEKAENINKFLDEDKGDEVRFETAPKEDNKEGKMDVTCLSETIPEESLLSGPTFVSHHREESPEQPHIRTNLYIDKLDDQI